MNRFVSYFLLSIILISTPVFGAGGWQFHGTKPQFLDSNGDPLVGGSITTYECSTTTLKATYPTKADAEAGSNPNSNPLILDSLGQTESVNVFTTGCLKVVLKDSSGVTLNTEDNLYGMDDLSTDSVFLVEHNADGTHNINVPDLDNYYPDYSATDQGVNGSNNTINYYLTTIGTSNKATIVLRHNSGGQYTDYVFSTTVDYSSYSNITFVIEQGARLDLDSGISLTLYSLYNVVAGDLQQILTGAGELVNSNKGEVFAGWAGVTYNNSLVAETNALLLSKAAKWGKVLVTDKLYISTTTAIDIDYSLDIQGRGPNAELVLMGATTEPIFNIDPTSTTSIDTLSLKGLKVSLDTATSKILFYCLAVDPYYIYIKNIVIEDNIFEGTIYALNYWNSSKLDPTAVTMGLDTMRVVNNKISNNDGNFLKCNNNPYRLVEILDNDVHNWSYSVFYFAIDSSPSYRTELAEAMQYINIRDNTATNDDSWWNSANGDYALFALVEEGIVEYTGNKVEGIHTENNSYVYDLYSNSRWLYYNNNKWINNVCLYSADKARNELLKSKGSQKATYSNSYFEVDPAYVTGLGKSLDYAWVTLYEQNQNTLDVHDCTFNIYMLRLLPSSGKDSFNVRFHDNTFNVEYIAGALVSSTADVSTSKVSIVGNEFKIGTAIWSSGTGWASSHHFYLTTGINTYEEMIIKDNILVGNLYESASKYGGVFLSVSSYAKNLIIDNNKITAYDSSHIGVGLGVMRNDYLTITNNTLYGDPAQISLAPPFVQYLPIDAKQLVVKNNWCNIDYASINITFDLDDMDDPTINKRIRFTCVAFDGKITKGSSGQFSVAWNGSRNVVSLNDSGGTPRTADIATQLSPVDPVSAVNYDLQQYLAVYPNVWSGETIASVKIITYVNIGLPHVFVSDNAAFVLGNWNFNFEVCY